MIAIIFSFQSVFDLPDTVSNKYPLGEILTSFNKVQKEIRLTFKYITLKFHLLFDLYPSITDPAYI